MSWEACCPDCPIQNDPFPVSLRGRHSVGAINKQTTQLKEKKMTIRPNRRSTVLTAIAVSVAALLFSAAFCSGAQARDKRPLVKILPLFEASDVPAVGPAEIPVPASQFTGTVPTGLPGAGLAQHPMLYIGETDNTIYIVNHGQVVWSYSTGPGNELDDAWMLSNGNILYTRMQYVAEITPEKQVVWRYDAPDGTQIHTCQPIGLNKVMFVLNALPPHLEIVDIKTGHVDVDHTLPCKSLTDQSSVHGQFRRARVLANGHYLVSFLEMGQVIEYDKNFNPVWTYLVKSPWGAIRLKNGNTLITDEQDVTTLEVDPKGNTVWSISKSDIPSQYWYGETQNSTRLANGDTIICSRGENGPQLVEVTRDKKVVWVLQDWKDVGAATAVQVLDEPGVPERPGDLAL
jgi:hypothetical protein